MAFRRPVKYDSYGNIKEFSDADIEEARNRLARRYISEANVYLYYVSSGGNLGTITDSRLKSGSYHSSGTAFIPESQTSEPVVVSVGYSRASQSVNTISAPNVDNFPVYYNGSGGLRKMSLQDVYDTFSYTALTRVKDSQPFKISTASSVASYTQQGQVFYDTRANVGAYTAAGIEETHDQPTTVGTYYLHKRNTLTTGSPPQMIRFSTLNNGSLQEYSAVENTDQDYIFQTVKHLASSVTGYRLRWSWNGSGSSQGSTISDTRLNGSGNYQTLQVGDDYRSQEFPNGSAYTVSNYNLRVRFE